MRVLPCLLVLLGACAPPTPKTAAELIATRGTPVAFDIACSQHRWSPADNRWKVGDGFQRTDTWLYANGATTDVFVIINGAVVDQARKTLDLTDAPNPRFNPRIVGCGETPATLTAVTGNPAARTTSGTAGEPALTFGSARVVVAAHVLKDRPNLVFATFVNGRLWGLRSQ
jgi:hypothetical protein